MARKEIKEILLEKELVTEEAVEKAEEIQKVSGEPLDEILVRMGYLTDIDRVQTLAKLLGVEFMNLTEVTITPEVLRLVPQHLALRHKVAPLFRRGEILVVAMVNPQNVIATDELSLQTGFTIQTVISPEEQIVSAIAKFYGSEMSMQDAMKGSFRTADIDSALSEIDLVGPGQDEAVPGADVAKLVEEAPVVKLVNAIIVQAIKEKASDIHVEPMKNDLRIRLRIDGLLHEVMSPPKAIQPILISRLKIMANMDISERRIPQDGRIQLVVEGKEFDFRVSTYPTLFGEKIVMRILDKSGTQIGLEKLGFDSKTRELFEELVQSPYGILLVTGPTGSGKTTTLYSVLQKLNTDEKHIITLEDPVEYQLDGINQIQVNEKAGLYFDNGLRSILRQDPDIVMVGEIRDFPTAEVATNAALTGHLVFSTLHTNDAPAATTRLMDMGIEPYLVASSLIGVLAQRLVRVICENCKEAYAVPSLAIRHFGVEMPEEKVTLYRGVGCDKCHGTGYSGRKGIFELMYLSDNIRDMITRKHSSVMIKEAARKEGMRTLVEDCLQKILGGMTTIEEAVRVVFVEG